MNNEESAIHDDAPATVSEPIATSADQVCATTQQDEETSWQRLDRFIKAQVADIETQVLATFGNELLHRIPDLIKDAAYEFNATRLLERLRKGMPSVQKIEFDIDHESCDDGTTTTVIHRCDLKTYDGRTVTCQIECDFGELLHYIDLEDGESDEDELQDVCRKRYEAFGIPSIEAVYDDLVDAVYDAARHDDHSIDLTE